MDMCLRKRHRSPPNSAVPYQQQSSNAYYGQQGGTYELVSNNFTGEVGESTAEHQLPTPSAPPMFDDVEPAVAEAYLVPPLVEVQAQAVQPDVETRMESGISARTSGNTPQTGYKTQFHDTWAAVLFVLNVVLVLFFAVRSIYVAKSDPHEQQQSHGNEDSDGGNSAVYFTFAKTGIIMSILLTAIATAIGSAGLNFLMKHSENLIEYVMWGNIIVQCTFAVISLLTFQLFGAILFAFMAGMSYWYLRSVYARIPFASSVLATGCEAVRANYQGVVTTAFVALAAQMLWGIVWALAWTGTIAAAENEDDVNSSSDAYRGTSTGSSERNSGYSHNNNNNSHNIDDDGDTLSSVNGVTAFLFFVSLFWGVQLISAVVKTTVSGTVACWWFTPQRESPVRGSLFRALTTSFGSLCMGSLLVAVVQALRQLILMLKNQAMRGRDRSRNNAGAFVFTCCLGLFDCLLRLLERAIQYFNTYAYCYVAAYGMGFLEAGHAVMDLFTKRGWTAIVNDDLVSNALAFGVFGLMLVNMLCGIMVSFLLDLFLAQSISDVGGFALMGAVIGLVTGLLVALILTTTLHSAVAMVFVCFAEDPAALQTNHPETYALLSDKWNAMHPGSLNWISSIYSAASGAASGAARGSGGGSAGGSAGAGAGVTGHSFDAGNSKERMLMSQVNPQTGGVGATGGQGAGIVYPAAHTIFPPPDTSTNSSIPYYTNNNNSSDANRTYMTPPSPARDERYTAYGGGGGDAGYDAYNYGGAYRHNYMHSSSSASNVSTSIPVAQPLSQQQHPQPSAPPAATGAESRSSSDYYQ